MSELSQRSGVAIPSIKFYTREGLVPPGVRTSPNQSTYDESHVARLRLVRALIDVGGLSVASVADVLGAIDNTDMPLDWAFGRAQRAIPGLHSDIADSHSDDRGAREIDALIAHRGWKVSQGNPGRALAARVLDTYSSLGYEHLISVLPAAAEAAEIMATADLVAVAHGENRAAMVGTVVVGTVLGDALFAGVRRIAQEHVSHGAFPAPAALDEDCEPGENTNTGI
jgi:DNA-binding transcriptional MerR regulator